jgi:hypothetical protein
MQFNTSGSTSTTIDWSPTKVNADDNATILLWNGTSYNESPIQILVGNEYLNLTVVLETADRNTTPYIDDINVTFLTEVGEVDDPPVISGLFPANGTSFTVGDTYYFGATTIYDVINLTSVALYINNTLNITNSSGTNNTKYNFSFDASIGFYHLYINATDNASQSTISGFHEISIVANVTDSCSCPGDQVTDHDFDLSDNCKVSSCIARDITFSNTGNVYCQGGWKVSNLPQPITDQTLWINGSALCRINVTG